MKVLGGVYIPDEGQIELDGKRLTLRSAGDALDHGIRVVFQELSSLENLSIAANVFLGREPRKVSGMLDSAEMVRRTKDILSRVGLNRSPEVKVSELPLAERQLVEIARALTFKVRILVFDD